MATRYLVLGALAAVGWIFVNGPPPPAEQAVDGTRGRPSAARPGATEASVTGDSADARRPSPESRRDPVPLVRTVRVSPAPPPAAEAPPAAVTPPAQDELDMRGAKAAAELDGYKRVSIVGRASNGAWRAKGYRGTTEVLLTVDGTGRVSMD